MNSDSHDLIEAFNLYYGNPTPYSVENLFFSIAHYSMIDWFEIQNLILDMRKVTPISKKQAGYFSSNGTTTNVRRRYSFGPYRDIWHKFLEGYDRHSKYLVFINCHPQPHKSPKEWIVKHNPVFREIHLLFNIYHYQFYELLQEVLDNIYENFGEMILFARPIFINQLLQRNSRFLEWLEANSFKVNQLRSTREDLFLLKNTFIPSSLYLNNRMIDWSNSTIFYTCSEGKTHFLPTFIQKEHATYDLLNLADKCEKSIQDLVVFNTHKQNCHCGKTYYQSTFIPHIARTPFFNKRYVYSLDLFRYLQENYFHIQFQQANNEDLNIFLCPEKNNIDDLEFLLDWWRQAGATNVNFVFNRFFQTDDKEPLFWRGDISTNKDFSFSNQTQVVRRSSLSWDKPSILFVEEIEKFKSL